MCEFRKLRNRVNRERKKCRAKYFQAKVDNLKKCKPSTWWNEVKKLSGCSPTSSTYRDLSKSLQHQYGSFDETSLANAINEAFLSPMHDYTPSI